MCHKFLFSRVSVCLFLRLYVHEDVSQYVMVVQGEMKAGREFLYSCQPSAYAKQPWETVNYADCHDGQTLFDQVLFHTSKTLWLMPSTDNHDHNGQFWLVSTPVPYHPCP